MKDERYNGSTFFNTADIKGSYRTGDSPNTCVIPVIAAIEQLNAKRDKEMEELIAENHRLVDTAKAFQKLIVDLQPAMEEATKLISELSTIMSLSASSVNHWEHEALKWLKKYGGKK